MPYVQRIENEIAGLFANPQPEFATEWLEDTDPEVVAFLNPPETLPDLAPYQFRAMLKLSGKQDDLYVYIDALPDPQKTIAQSKLEYSLTFKRDNDLVMAAQQALGFTTEELDALWSQAAAIL